MARALISATSAASPASISSMRLISPMPFRGKIDHIAGIAAGFPLPDQHFPGRELFCLANGFIEFEILRKSFAKL
jgi:hypothetical protein